MGIVGRRGTLATFLAKADIPALLRKGALEPLEGKFDFIRNCLHVGNMGVQVLSNASVAGHYVLSVPLSV